MINNTKGFSLLAVLLLLVGVGIIGYTGWFVYHSQQTADKNYSSQPSSTQTATPTPKIPMVTGKIDAGFPVGVSWSYPQTWSLSKEGNAPTSSSDSIAETMTLTSPSKGYAVVYEVAQNEGFGGRCDSSEPATIQYINRQNTLNLPKAIFVESIVDNYSAINDKYTLEGYRYSSALMNNVDNVAKAKVGDTQCATYLQGPIKLSSNPDTYLMRAEVRLNNIEKTDKYGDVLPFKDAETIKSQYNSAEYKEAVKVLLSTQIGN